MAPFQYIAKNLGVLIAWALRLSRYMNIRAGHYLWKGGGGKNKGGGGHMYK